MKFYAGIGSRETPKRIEQVIDRIVLKLNTEFYTLRSGGANGADSMFEKLAQSKEIYLPWDNFNDNKSTLHQQIPFDIKEKSIELVKKYHPKFTNLSDAGIKLMARNGHQVLGFDLQTPVDFIVCWTREGKAIGGTSQAIRIANDLNIPIFNLFFEDAEQNLYKYLHQLNNSLF